MSATRSGVGGAGRSCIPSAKRYRDALQTEPGDAADGAAGSL